MRRAPSLWLAALGVWSAVTASPPVEALARHASATTASSGVEGSARLQEVADEYWQFLQNESLTLRLRQGLPVDRLPEISLQKSQANAAFGQSLSRKLEPLRESDLSHEEQLSLAILRKEAQQLVEAPNFYWLTFPLTPYSFRNLGVFPVFSSHSFRTQADRDHYLMLLGKFPGLMRSIEEKLRGQFRRGIVLAKEEIPLVVGLFGGPAGEKEQNLFWVKSERLAALPSADREVFLKRLAAVIETQIRPAVKSLIGFLSGDYRAKAPDAVGLGQYPGGKDFYRALVKRNTTLDLSPEEIHRIGLAGIEALNTQLEGVRRTVGFAGSLEDFRPFLKTDSRFFAKEPEEVGERLLVAQNRIVGRVTEFFGKTPRAPFGVKRLEPELEGALTFGYYQAPTATDPKGYYKYNGSNLNERTLLGAGSLIAHELVPGHHFQINLQRENGDLPRFRRESGYTAFTEGWGEYASDLAGEMGMYADPYDRAGRLSMDLFLTSRLVVDTGMNYFGWPRLRAIEFMKANTLQSATEIETETLRYSCDMPGQALAYKIGMRKLTGLRDGAQKALGPAFDIKKFHDALLGSGSMPLDVLERHIDWFIAREKGKLIAR